MLDNSGAMTLTAINEDDTGNSGTRVSDIIASAGGDRITDADPSALEGIAVTAASAASGAWQYSTNDGATWTALGSPSDAAARLLASDTATRVRFVPVADFNGLVDPGITFRAWDQTQGAGGGTADTTVSGGTTAFSTATETASINVLPVNDAPSFTKGADQSVLQDAGPQTVVGWATNISPGPPNESTQTVQFFVSNDNPSLFDPGGQPAIAPSGTLTFMSAPAVTGAATLTVSLQDNGGTANGGQDTSAPQTFTITVLVKPVTPTPTSVDLAAASDTGISDADDITRLDNSAADKVLAFVVSGTTSGATVAIDADGTEIGSAVAAGTTTTVTSNGVYDLADGGHSITARQSKPGEFPSGDSPPRSITVDTVPPSPGPSLAPDMQAASDSGSSPTDNYTNDNTPTFDIDPAAAPYFVFYRDGAATSGYEAAAASYTTAVQADGTYLYRVSASDAAGNESALSTGLSVTIDTIPPPPVQGPTGITNDPTLTLIGVEAGALVEYSIDGGTTWTSFFTPVEGLNTVLVRMIDRAGNISPPSPITFTLDTIPPAAPGVALTTDTGISPTNKVTSIGLLTLTGVEPDATVEYSINGGTTWTSTFTSVEGSNAVQVRQTDLAGNIGPASAPFTFTLDTQGPTVTTYSLANDTGVSPADQITSDTTPVLTFVLSEPVLGTDADVTVTKPSGGVFVPDSITGWGTNTLTIALLRRFPKMASTR